MEANFSVGDRVRIRKGHGFDNETGVVKAASKSKEGLWKVELDDTLEIVVLPETALGKLAGDRKRVRGELRIDDFGDGNYNRFKNPQQR